MNVLHISAFSDGDTGGNPAGVVIGDTHPAPADMQAAAAKVGYSETVFAMPTGDGRWRVRYFSPQSEVPFCGHATIALGAALAGQFGEGVYDLVLNDAEITVEGRKDEGRYHAALQSPETRSRISPPDLTGKVLDLFGYAKSDLDERIPPAVIHGGADHFVLALNARQTLSNMRYDMEAGRKLMTENGWVTILLAHCENQHLFHTRNPFASGGVYEDPATGAASAAFAGYLRDIDWPHAGGIEIIQGSDMGAQSRISIRIPDAKGSSVRVSGAARLMETT
ncbi:PhzF family phenazine biosynthesis protein [Roseibium sp. RKSG952]|uniref:PhzF family phenazine biosynthesis protein n=1 Tax=Roseibium sp. RKSG952 TaxID=2529384 RepID=UPI0012BD67AE|nr:PhzF family phenazine biosynthesis protein [Roseibium sp. RKSG952]MTH96242.1 PhzF family phenazine biosynthesis protein [Roseibium sp. RKSG952]